MAFWAGNKCGNCGFQSPVPLEKLICGGEQAGLEACCVCSCADPRVPEGLRLTRDRLMQKIIGSRPGQ